MSEGYAYWPNSDPHAVIHTETSTKACRPSSSERKLWMNMRARIYRYMNTFTRVNHLNEQRELSGE